VYPDKAVDIALTPIYMISDPVRGGSKGDISDRIGVSVTRAIRRMRLNT
jgi:hypothetical protein